MDPADRIHDPLNEVQATSVGVGRTGIAKSARAIGKTAAREIEGARVDAEPTGHLLAVMAHSLLNSVASIQTAALMLDTRERLNDDQLDAVVLIIRRQADHLHEMLKDLVRTGDPALMATLDDLDRKTPLSEGL